MNLKSDLHQIVCFEKLCPDFKKQQASDGKIQKVIFSLWVKLVELFFI